MSYCSFVFFIHYNVHVILNVTIQYLMNFVVKQMKSRERLVKVHLARLSNVEIYIGENEKNASKYI